MVTPTPQIKDGHHRGVKVKEDDRRKKEDDQQNSKRKKHEDKESGRPPPPRMVREMDGGDTPPAPPPGRHGCPPVDGGIVPEGAGSLPTMCMDGWVASPGQLRADVSTERGGSDESTRRTAFASKKTADGITINGVSLMVLQKMKMKNSSDRKTTPNNKKTPQRKYKKTMTTTPSNNSIEKYLTKKTAGNKNNKNTFALKTTPKEDNVASTEVNDENSTRIDSMKNTSVVSSEEDKKKTTFKPLNTASTAKVTENIKMFQELVDGAECRLGSGRCSTHNVKLVRNVCKKRVSCVTDNGRVTWSMREGVTLACPYKQAHRTDAATEPEPLMYDGANKNKRICLNRRMNQPQTELDKDFGREETLLVEVKTDCWPPDKK